MRAPPQWAQELTISAILYLEAKGYKADLPILTWRHGSGQHSSGHASWNSRTITVTAGKLRVDQKLVLLHEITHTVTEPDIKYLNIEKAKKRGWHFTQEPTQPIISKRMCHTASFWNTAFDLYRWAKLPRRYCLQREMEYRKAAKLAYHRSRKP